MVKTLYDWYSPGPGQAGKGDNFLAIRIIAASLVIYGHSFALAARNSGETEFFGRYFGYRYAGEAAVVVFFLISGLLVAGSLDRRERIRDFLHARAARLLPGLIVCVLVCTLVVGPLVTTLTLTDYLKSHETWRYALTNFSLWKVSWTLPGVFEQNNEPGVVNGSLWTLPLEARMYAYLALLGAAGLLRRRALGTAAVLLVLVWVALRHPPDYLAADESGRLTMVFGVGVLLYMHRRYVPINAALLAGLMALTWFARNSGFHEPLFVLTMCYAVIWTAYVPRVPMPRWIGDISYGTYLYAWPVQQLLAQSFPQIGPGAMTLLALPLVWSVAALSWRYVEKPALAINAARAGAPSHTALPTSRRPAVP